jgi:hypothetical protein
MEDLRLFRITEIISSCSILIPCITALISFRAIKNSSRAIAVLIICGLITEFINIVHMLHDTNNQWIVRAYTLMETISICVFYFLFFKTSFKSVYILLIIPVFIIVFVLDFIANGIDSFDNYSTSLESIMFCALALWSFYYVIHNSIITNLIQSDFFWFNTGFLVYFGGNLVIFVFNNYLMKETNSHLAIWTIHSILNIIYNIVLAIGFWKTRRP